MKKNEQNEEEKQWKIILNYFHEWKKGGWK